MLLLRLLSQMLLEVFSNMESRQYEINDPLLPQTH